MNMSPAGIALLKSFESCRLTAYQDQGGVWTIGWGHTSPAVVQGLVWTQAQADAQLALDIAGRAERFVNPMVPAGGTLPQNKFDAFCDLCYNIGAGHFRSSTLVRLWNAGDAAGAAEQFLVWDKDGGVVDAGLTRRREAERALFLQS